MNISLIMQRIGSSIGPIANTILIIGGIFLLFKLIIDPLTAPISIEIYEKRKNRYKRKLTVGRIIKKQGVPRLKIYNMAGPINLFYKKALYIQPVDGRFLISLSNSKDKLILIKDGEIYKPVEPNFDAQEFKGYINNDLEFWAQQERKNTLINYATPLKGFEKYQGIISLMLVIGIVLVFFIVGLREMNKAIESAANSNAKAAEVSNQVMSSAKQVMDEAHQVLSEIKIIKNGGK